MPIGTTNKTTETTISNTEPVKGVATKKEETAIPRKEVENLPEVHFVVEDGTGIHNSNSYCDLDFAVEYAVMKGYDSWNELSEEQQKVFLIRGTEYIDNFYNWKGRRRTQDQAMSFPRVELYDLDRFEVRGIPIALKKACVEAAFLNSQSTETTLFSTSDTNGDVKKQKVDSLEVEYFQKEKSTSTTRSKVDYTSIYEILNKILKGLYFTGDKAISITTPARWIV